MDKQNNAATGDGEGQGEGRQGGQGFRPGARVEDSRQKYHGSALGFGNKAMQMHHNMPAIYDQVDVDRTAGSKEEMGSLEKQLRQLRMAAPSQPAPSSSVPIPHSTPHHNALNPQYYGMNIPMERPEMASVASMFLASSVPALHAHTPFSQQQEYLCPPSQLYPNAFDDPYQSSALMFAANPSFQMPMDSSLGMPLSLMDHAAQLLLGYGINSGLFYPSLSPAQYPLSAMSHSSLLPHFSALSAAIAPPLPPPQRPAQPFQHRQAPIPSRTLFVRNISNHSSDQDILSLFGRYGDIKDLSTRNKETKGFVLVTYFDLRSGISALLGLQGIMLDGRALNLHFSNPKTLATAESSAGGSSSGGSSSGNQSDFAWKIGLEATIVVMNVPELATDEELIDLFGSTGCTVRQVRSKQSKRQTRFVEFFDSRHTETAISTLQSTEFKGSRLKMEKSRFMHH